MEKNKKSIVLFGCSQMGYEALQLIGGENILCFCDNNKSLHGTVRWDKQVVSVEKLKQDYGNFTVVICIRNSKAHKVAFQLDKEGISDYWIYHEIADRVSGMQKDERLHFLRDKNEMFRMRMEYYQNKIKELTSQLDYMKKHADIKSMKPATGALRERQMENVKFAGFVCKALFSELHVSPFLEGGNLLGYVRHNGFIPWDDDFDVGLFREDYERLREYCHASCDEDGYFYLKHGERIEHLRFSEGYGLFALIKKYQGDKNIAVDFFSYDYYTDDYPFGTLRNEAKRISKNTYEMHTLKEAIDYVKAEMNANQAIVKKSNSIYFGFDNLASYAAYDRGQMIPEEVLLPLKTVEFEGEEFFVPNNPEELLTYIYDDIWSFPEDVGIQKHVAVSEN